MTDDAQSPYRIVLAAIGSDRDVLDAVNNLGSVGVAASAVSIIGTRAAVDRLPRPARSPILRHGILIDEVATVFDRHASPIVAAHGGLLQRLKPPRAVREGSSSGRCWLPPGHRDEMLRTIDEGMYWLLVDARTPEQWVSSTRVLLPLSPRPIIGIVRAPAKDE